MAVNKKLKVYMGYDNLGGSSEGAILIFAHTAREAKKVAWNSYSFIQEICDGEYINLRVRLERNANHLFKEANQDKLKADEPHVIESPTTCNGCELWGYELNKEGYCEDCQADREGE